MWLPTKKHEQIMNQCPSNRESGQQNQEKTNLILYIQHQNGSLKPQCDIRYID